MMKNAMPVITILLVFVCSCTGLDRAAEPAEPIQLFNVEPEVPAAEEAPVEEVNVVAVAAELLADGHQADAARVLEYHLSIAPEDSEALALLVQTLREKAAEARASGRGADEFNHYARALSTLAGCYEYALAVAPEKRDWLNGMDRLRQQLVRQVRSRVEQVIAQAGALYEEGRTPWYRRNIRGKFIEALVLLDGVNQDLLARIPMSTRRDYAAIWAKCFDRLGNAAREEYKTTTALVNMVSE